MNDPIRDDTAEPFPISGNGPLTERIDGWKVPEQFPLHADFQMPPPRASRPEFIHRSIAQRVIDSFGTSDAEFAEAIEAMQAALDGGENRNSGSVAQIQGQG